mmetsp:Transcript_25476/g.61236  ORF Transcript_25476/g.61236 Transcript_25476/m.61236 type:complete len:295 (-) Transcript_25476:1295-2179(-)
MAEESAPKRRRTSSEENSVTDRPCHDIATEPVNVDVGGVLFRVSKTTLTHSSSYFESMMSERWHFDEKEGNERDSEAIFVDQDPKAFELILNYMRSGMVYLPREDRYLCKKTLMLAEYLGIHGFLVTVKAITMKHISRREDFLSDEASEAAQFDVRFGSLRMAVDKGILPICYFPPSDELRIKVSDKIFHASKKVLIEKSGYFGRLLTSNPEDYWKQDYISGENPDVMEVALQMLSSPNSAFTTMTEKFHRVSGQNVKFRHFYVQAILTWLDKLQLPVDFRDNCVQTITHTFNA